MGDTYYSFAELKRITGNDINKLADQFEFMADWEEATEEEEILFQNIAGFLRQTADDHLFTKTPPRFEGNVIDWEDHYEKRRG